MFFSLELDIIFFIWTSNSVSISFTSSWNTVLDRSNLTGNSLLEHKWNVKWKAAGTPKFRWSWSAFWTRMHYIENAIMRTIENALTCSIENLWFARRLWCYSMPTKFCRREVIVFLHFLVSYIKLCNDKFRILSIAQSWHVAGQITTYLIGTSRKNTNQCLDCLRMEDQGVLNHQTFLVKNFPFLLSPQKQDDRCAFKWDYRSQI